MPNAQNLVFLTPSCQVAKLKSMLRARLCHHRAFVVGFLLICLTVSLATKPHADSADADACSVLLVSHDETAHYVGAAPQAAKTADDHCFLCHSLRSLGSVLDKFEQRETIRHAERLHVPALTLVDRIEWSLVLGRAPPQASI